MGSNKASLLIFLGIASLLEITSAQNHSIDSMDMEGSIKFAKYVVNVHFKECGVIRIWRSTESSFTNEGLTVPGTLIRMDDSGEDPFQYYNHSAGNDLIAKHRSQCLVYLVSLSSFKEDDLEGLYKAFKIRHLQVLATFSYLMIPEFEDIQTAETFVLSKELHNYPHRVILSEPETELGSVCLKRFCYFCVDGNPGFIPDSRGYLTPLDLHFISEIFPDVIRDFNGRPMRIVAPPAPPLVLISPSKSKPGQNEIQGQQANIVYSFSHYFNFTVAPHPSPATGIKLPNGTWTGIMGEILYGTADIGVSVATSHERYQIVDATVSVFYAFLVLVSTKPKPTFEWQAIFYPFKSTCWLAFIVSTIFTFYASKWLHNNAIRYEMGYLKKTPEVLKKMKGEIMTNYKSFYITVGQLLEQGTPFDFNTTPSRMYVIYWMFFAMIITTAYRSKLFLFLTFPTVEVPPNNFLELSRSTYKYGMKHLGGIALVFITKSPLSYIRGVGEKMSVYSDKFTCLDRTFTERFTCIIYKAYIDYVAEVRYWKVKHQLHISASVTPPVGSSWVLPKYAPWLPSFDKISSSIYEMNLAEKYLEKYQVKVAKILRELGKAHNSTQDSFKINDEFKGEDDGPKPLVMANLYAAFFILIFGLSLAGILLFMEIVRRKKFKEKLRKKKDRLRFHLMRRAKKERKKLPPGASKLSFQQVVRVIMPNSNDIIELSREYYLK